VTVFPKSPPDDWSVWHDVFERHGAPGTVEGAEPPSLGAYLAPGDESRIPGLLADLAALGPCRTETSTVIEEDWAETWKQFFKPKAIGPFLVSPTWERAARLDGSTEILLDPGQAFGTGDHPTTRMCLELMPGLGLEGKRVADIGCGSGILSIAAAKLGAREVHAVDVDRAAVEATVANTGLNRVRAAVFQGRGFAPLPSGRYNAVLSNLVSAVLIGLAAEASARIEPGGAWLVSGVIAENWADVLASAQTAGFSLGQSRQEDEWVAAVFFR
jgi:ribosomal protein L11 methyltransferase